MEIKLTHVLFFLRRKLLTIIMRTFIFLLCTTVFGFTPDNVLSQNTKIKIDRDQTVTVDEVFDIIMEQTDYTFIYQIDMFKDFPKVKLNKGSIKANDLLQKSLSGDRFNFKLTSENTIVITSKDEKTSLQQSIKGIVLQENGDPLLGVTILVKNTNRGTTTDIDGAYDIQADVGEVLVFSYVGFVTQEITVGDNSVIDVKLLQSASVLDEVVLVSTGYQTISKERVTGSYATIGSEELRRAGSNLSLKNRIEDLVPGLYFETNFDGDQSAPNDDSRSIVIRGVSTFGNNNPLIVVDGFALDPDIVDPFSILNPDDVESVTVLKDAAAASIWGAQAANGVIVIVTKKGNKGVKKPMYNIILDFLVKPKPNLSDIPWAGSGDAIDFYRGLILDNDYYDPLLGADYDRYELPPAIRTLIDIKSGRISQQDGNARLDELANRDVRDEFSDLFLQTEIFKRANLAVSISGEKNTARASLTAITNDSYSIGDKELEFLANMNNEYNATDWLTLGMGLNVYITQEENNGVGINELSFINQQERILDDNGNYLPMIKNDNTINFYEFATDRRQDSVASLNLPYNWDWNLKQDVDNRDNTFEQYNLRLNTRIAVKPIKPLTLELLYQYTSDNAVLSNYYNENTWATRNTINYLVRPDGTLPVPPGGMLTEYKTASFSHNVRAQFIFNKKFGVHDITVLGGTEWRKDVSQTNPYGYYGYDPQALTSFTQIDFSEPITPRIDGSRPFRNTVPVLPGTTFYSGIQGKDNRFVSYYGNFGYNFNLKYDLTGSIRIDKTNLYGQNASYRDLPQWSLGAGWNIDNESFFDFDFIDKLRLRTSFGFNGNIDKSASPYIQGWPWNDPVTLLPYTGVQTSPNPNLTWERTKVFNVGLDFRLLGNRLYGSFEYYTKKTEDVLVSTEVNGTYGYQNNRATVNAGNIKNNGIELNLASAIIDREDISWRSQFILGTNENKTSGYSAVGFSIDSYLRLPYFFHIQDKPVDYIYAMRFAGYDDEGLPQYFYGSENEVVSSGDGIRLNVSELDSVARYVGRRNPNVFGSFSNSVRYKNFELNVRLSYKFGHKFSGDYPANNITRNYYLSNNYFTWLSELIPDRWQSPADGDTAGMHSLNGPITNFNTRTNIRYLEQYGDHKIMDAGQIRLQAINLGYTFSSPKFKWMSNASIQLEARNLGPIWVANDEGIDPSNPPYSSSQYGALRYVTRFRPEYSLSLRIGLQ